jgi:ABC-2 type transport system ATP-binding protein
VSTYGVRSVSVAGRLEGVSLTAPAGSITAVVGGDGAGKTTLLRLLVGAMLPDSGVVLAPESARQIGYSPTGSGYYPDLTVQENLEFAAHAYRMAPDDFRSRSGYVLGLTGLADFTGRLAQDLSGGMRQKLALAIGTLHDPELLVLDEPTTGVDPVSRTDLWRIIASAAASGVHVVVSTSYLDEAERASTVVALDGGRTILEGAPAELRRQVPGTLEDLAEPTDHDLAWRIGRTWRQWNPDGASTGDAVEPTLEDAVIVATLR